MSLKPSCECGACAKCKHRARMARYREGPSSKELRDQLEQMREYRRTAQEQNACIRALGPRAPGSTLCPERVFLLRESKSK